MGIMGGGSLFRIIVGVRGTLPYCNTVKDQGLQSYWLCLHLPIPKWQVGRILKLHVTGVTGSFYSPQLYISSCESCHKKNKLLLNNDPVWSYSSFCALNPKLSPYTEALGRTRILFEVASLQAKLPKNSSASIEQLRSPHARCAAPMVMRSAERTS